MSYGSAALLLACKRREEAKPAPSINVETSWKPILLAATDAVIGFPIPDHAHYDRFLEFRFTQIPSYRELYLRLATTLETRSQQEAHTPFTAGKPEDRSRLVADVLDRDPHAADYDAYFRGEVLALFAKTDAFVMLGYDSWPGVARGFDGLQDAPKNGAR